MSNSIDEIVGGPELGRAKDDHYHASVVSPFKRVIDVSLALVGLVFAAPLMLLTALIIKLFDRGTVIFAQTRIGLNGETFKCYKFRTMAMDADKQLQELLARDPEARREWSETRKLKNDPRITPLGKFLRKSSIDELPQLWNVLMGEMSLVGPRPIVHDEIAKYGPYFKSYSAVRPGLTGLWQVNGRSNTAFDARIKLDEDYAENWSVMRDVKLIALTVPALLFSRGAM